jgi:hypothetical protein
MDVIGRLLSITRMSKPVKREFLDIVNFAICKTVNETLHSGTRDFFRKVGEYHLDEAMKRGYIKIDRHDRPLDVMMGIATYLESMGYMGRIEIDRLSETEAMVEMHDVSVTGSSVQILGEKKTPSHYMTNLMIAALKRLGIKAELEDVQFDREKNRFIEHWRILGRVAPRHLKSSMLATGLCSNK